MTRRTTAAAALALTGALAAPTAAQATATGHGFDCSTAYVTGTFEKAREGTIRVLVNGRDAVEPKRVPLAPGPGLLTVGHGQPAGTVVTVRASWLGKVRRQFTFTVPTCETAPAPAAPPSAAPPARPAAPAPCIVKRVRITGPRITPRAPMTRNVWRSNVKVTWRLDGRVVKRGSKRLVLRSNQVAAPNGRLLGRHTLVARGRQCDKTQRVVVRLWNKDPRPGEIR